MHKLCLLLGEKHSLKYSTHCIIMKTFSPLLVCTWRPCDSSFKLKLQQGLISIISFIKDYVWEAQELEGSTGKGAFHFQQISVS